MRNGVGNDDNFWGVSTVAECSSKGRKDTLGEVN